MAIPLTVDQQLHLAGNVVTLCSCYELIRVDGFTLRLTDHDEIVTFNGKTYSPQGAGNTTAHQRVAGLRERNTQILGVLESGAITHEDLRTGKYRNAVLIVDIVNWKLPEMGSFRRDYFWIKELTYSGEEWEAKLTGLSTLLNKTVGRVYTRTCRHNLGDEGCKVDLTGTDRTGTVISANPRRSVFTSDLTTEADHHFAHGRLIWTGGANAGFESEVWSYLSATGQFILKLDTPYDISSGDTFRVFPGCAKNIATCTNKFNNVVNFGGFPFIPGTDKMLEVPSAGQAEIA